METILVWTLVIAALAILLMLALLIVSERELKRKSAEVESLRTRYRNADTGNAVKISAEETAGVNEAAYTETAALNDDLQSTIDILRTELDRLRADNARLGQANKINRGEIAPTAHSAASPKFAGFTLRAAESRRDKAKRRWRNIIVVSAAALLLLTGLGAYLISDWRETEIGEIREANVPSESQSDETRTSTETLALTHTRKSTEASKSSETRAPIETRESNKTQESSETRTSKAVAALEAGKKPLPAPRVADSPRAKTETSSPAKTASPKTPMPLNVSYEIVEPTRVFSEPNEGSRPVASVDAGTEINVVGVRDEWLEVRSRHGRPPGFIRKNTAKKKEPS